MGKGKRALSKQEKQIRSLEERLGQIDEQLDLCFNQAKEFGKKGDVGKATQAQTRWAILIDKRKVLAEELQKLRVAAPTEDLTLKFEQESAELFYQWLQKRDKGYHHYLSLIKNSPKLLEKILKEECNKEIKTEDLIKEIIDSHTQGNQEAGREGGKNDK